MIDLRTGAKKQNLYTAVVKNAWPYWVGAIMLGLMNFVIFLSFGSPWGITTTFAVWAAWLAKLAGASPETWVFFEDPRMGNTLAHGFFTHTGSLMNAGVIGGALLASLAASEFRLRTVKSRRQIVAALLGGILMGYGARLSFGCNIGAYFSAIGSLSVHGWVYALFIFMGAFIGSRLLVKYFL